MSRVKVVNPVWNGSGLVKRKVADYYVAEGRAEWLFVDPREEFYTGRQIRLVESHPKNMAAAARAGSWDSEERGPLRYKDAMQRPKLRFERPPLKALAFESEKRLVIRDSLMRPDPGPDFHQVVQSNGLRAKWHCPWNIPHGHGRLTAEESRDLRRHLYARP